MPFYRYHVFFCLHERADGSACCAQHPARKLQAYAKKRMQALNLHGPGQVRINQSGCLGRCDLGPALVVYPDQVWYSYVDEEDIDEIITSHLLHGQPVERLRLPTP